MLKKIQYSLPWTYPAEIKALIPSGSTILDVGCGDGHLMAWINNDGSFKAVGVDINKKDLEMARKRKVYKDLIAADLIKNLPFREKFDVVLCSQVVEHLEKKKALALIKKIEKLAKKRIIVATINGFFQFDHRSPGKYDIHLSRWSSEELTEMDYIVYGHGLRFIYKPGTLKDKSPKFLHPLLFFISYLMTPILRFIHPAALLLIAHKDFNKD